MMNLKNIAVEILDVSIPQAVWIACNKESDMTSNNGILPFQYRKRYGLHAIMKNNVIKLGAV